MVEPTKTELLSIAKEAVLKAGHFLNDYGQNYLKINHDLPHDMKIEADCQSEKVIIEFLEQKTEISILSEEKGLIERPNKQYRWIVDPIDGSINYFRGIPLTCVSLGLWQGQSPILGAVYDFEKEELFYGIAGGKSYLNGSEINVSQTISIKKAILCSGFPGKADLSSASIGKLIQQIQEYRKVRFLGSAALSIAYVACGRADAYYEESIMIWDIAGAVPIVLGAGGKFELQEAGIPDCFNVYISNKDLK